MPKNPLTAPRSSGGKTAKMSAIARGKSAAPPAPCSTRKKMSEPMFQESPHNAEPIVNRVSEPRKMRLMPKRLAR